MKVNLCLLVRSFDIKKDVLLLGDRKGCVYYFNGNTKELREEYTFKQDGYPGSNFVEHLLILLEQPMIKYLVGTNSLGVYLRQDNQIHKVIDSYNLVCYSTPIFLSSTIIAGQSKSAHISIFNSNCDLSLKSLRIKDYRVEKFELESEIHSIFNSNSSLVILGEFEVYRYNYNRLSRIKIALKPHRRVVMQLLKMENSYLQRSNILIISEGTTEDLHNHYICFYELKRKTAKKLLEISVEKE